MSKTTYYIGRRQNIEEWADMHGLAYLDDHKWLDLETSAWSMDVNRGWIEDVVRQVKQGTAELVVLLWTDETEQQTVFAHELQWIESLGLEYDKWSAQLVVSGSIREPAWIAEANRRCAMAG